MSDQAARANLVLRKARRLIESPANWVRGAFATNLHGKVVPTNSPAAACFCLVGAVYRAEDKVSGPGRVTVAMDVLQRVLRESKRHVVDLTELNDRMGHEAVLLVLDEAIRRTDATQYEEVGG